MTQFDSTCWFINPAAIGILCCSIILISACDSDRSSSVSGPQAVERGEQLFNDNCGFCHGAEGRGPKLTELTSLSENDRRGRVINHPIAGQIPQRLRAHELADLNEFLNSK
jgi:mono/diheme cytochrome c family protein